MKTLTNWRHPRCTVESRVQFPLWRRQKASRTGLNPAQEPRSRQEPSADPGSANAGLPAPDRSRYKEDLQWIPALSAASFRVVGRWQDGNHIAVGQLDDLLRWLQVAVTALVVQCVALRHVFVVPPLGNATGGNINLRPAAVEGAVRVRDWKHCQYGRSLRTDVLFLQS